MKSETIVSIETDNTGVKFEQDTYESQDNKLRFCLCTNLKNSHYSSVQVKANHLRAIIAACQIALKYLENKK